jgi:hypothetical protein
MRQLWRFCRPCKARLAFPKRQVSQHKTDFDHHSTTVNMYAVSDLEALQGMHTRPPRATALLESAISASQDLGNAVAQTRSALAEVTLAVNVHHNSCSTSLEKVPPSQAVQASAEAVTSAARVVLGTASAQLNAVKGSLAETQAVEEQLMRQLAELQAHSEALTAAEADRAASAASPGQQAMRVQQWYEATAAKLGALTGCTVLSVKPLSDGTVLATVVLSALSGARLEVLCAVRGGARGADAPTHTIKSVAVKGNVPLGASQVAQLQAQAVHEGHLGGFQAACC